MELLIAFVVGVAVGAFLVALGIEVERRRLTPTLLAYVESTAVLQRTLAGATWHAVPIPEPTRTVGERMH